MEDEPEKEKPPESSLMCLTKKKKPLKKVSSNKALDGLLNLREPLDSDEEREKELNEKPLKLINSSYEQLTSSPELIEIKSKEKDKTIFISPELVAMVPVWQNKGNPIETDIPTKKLITLILLLKTQKIHPHPKSQEYWLSKHNRTTQESEELMPYANQLGLTIPQRKEYTSIANMEINVSEGILDLNNLRIDSLTHKEEQKSNLSKVTNFYLNNNFIHQFPNPFVNVLISLKLLHLDKNFLEKLPDFSSLPLLSLLSCKDNEIVSLNESNLSNCEKLKTIDLENNFLTSIQSSQVPKYLTELFLSGNPLDDESKQALKKKESITSHSGLD